VGSWAKPEIENRPAISAPATIVLVLRKTFIWFSAMAVYLQQEKGRGIAPSPVINASLQQFDYRPNTTS
jgi:hypothetical protein